MNGNYREKYMRLYAEGKAPREPALWHMQILHDDWCSFLKDPATTCDCDPDIRFFDVHGEPWKGEK